MFKSVNHIELSFLLVLAFVLQACTEYVPFPRRYGFHRIELPQSQARSYTAFALEACPFSFEYPAYGKITRSNPDSCWVDIYMPPYDLTWHITYRDMPSTGKTRDQHFEEYRTLIYKHTKKATRIQPTPITGPTGEGIQFEIDGNVGTPTQVFYHDSSDTHLMMMSFYYQTALKNDSLAPVTAYMKEEVTHMLETLTWQ